jgi:hypothetical protein
MFYTKKEKFNEKRDFYLSRLPMIFGSLCNLYSKSEKPPSPDELYEKAIELCEKSWELGTSNDDFPELDEKLMEKIFEEEELHERRIGRYYASELYQYFTNQLPPEKFLNPPTPTLGELKRMYWGTIIHQGIQKLFSFEEKKYEISLGYGIFLISKPDLELPNGEIIEIKTKDVPEIYDTLPTYYLYQCTAYLKAKNLKKMRLYIIGWGLSRKKFEVEFNPKIWEEIVKRLKEYHERVLKYAQEKE